MRNFNEFIKTRPPMVLFTICLIILAFSFIMFAFYIENTDDILNTDVQENWQSLKKHFSSLSMCITDISAANTSIVKQVNNDYSKEYSVFTLSSMNVTEALKKIGLVKGILSLEGWSVSCPRFIQQPDFMWASFEIPKNVNLGMAKICIRISGPKEYLPTFINTACQINDTQTSKGILTSLQDKNNPDFCKAGIKADIQFDSQQIEEFAVYLSDEDVHIVFRHLIWCGSVLLLLIFLFAAYAMCHKIKTAVDDL